jgi:hypothetical protein
MKQDYVSWLKSNEGGAIGQMTYEPPLEWKRRGYGLPVYRTKE